MGQVSSKLRRGPDRYFHWCPGCEEMHPLPDSWQFNGNLENPTFTPSFLHSGLQLEKKDGKWTGNWVRDAAGNTIPWTCHYVVTNGMIAYQADCSHSLKGQTIPMPPLPEELRDDHER